MEDDGGQVTQLLKAMRGGRPAGSPGLAAVGVRPVCHRLLEIIPESRLHSVRWLFRLTPISRGLDDMSTYSAGRSANPSRSAPQHQ